MAQNKSVGLRADGLDHAIHNPSRLATLMNTGLVGSPIEEAFDRLTRLAAHTVRAPVSLVSLVAEERQFFKSVFGLPEPWASRRETPLTHSFCRHMVATGEPLIVTDARQHPLVQDNPAIRDLGVIAYAGMPLTLHNGETIGSFCVIDSVPREWTQEELALLRELSFLVITEIELRLMMQAREELLDLMFHDLKNPLNAILLSMELLGRMPVAQREDILGRSVERVYTSADLMLQMIRDVSDLNAIEAGSFRLSPAQVPVRSLLDRVSERLKTPPARSKITLRFDAEGDWTLCCDRERIERVLMNFVSAVMNLHGVGPEIRVSVQRRMNRVVFRVRADQPDLTNEEAAHLFDRFWKTRLFTSKGVKLSLALSQEIVKMHDGAAQAVLSDGGTELRFELPVSESG